MNELRIRKVVLDTMPKAWRAVIDPMSHRTDADGAQWYDVDSPAYKAFREKFPVHPTEHFDLKIEGPLLWRKFHIGTLTRQPHEMPSLAREIVAALGCMECAKHFEALVKQFPPPCTTPRDNFVWGVGMHNRVNARIQPPKSIRQWKTELEYWQREANNEPGLPKPCDSDVNAMNKAKATPASDGPRFYTADGAVAHVNGAYRDRSAFLVLSGPSLRQLDLSQLDQRGILTMAVNNAWTVYRPKLWVSVDTARRFSDVGWKDPGIIKFVPAGNIRNPIRETLGDGSRVIGTKTVADMPGVFYFIRNGLFDASTFLTSSLVHWGNETKLTDTLKIKGKRSVMLAALHILYGLGVRTVYLIGADFKMDQHQGYAFEESRSESATKYNNTLYAALDQRFHALRPHFARHGFNVLNATPGSGLTAFDRIDFEDAVRLASAECAGVPLLTEGWYVEDPKKKPQQQQPRKVSV